MGYGIRNQPSIVASIIYLIVALATPNNKILFILATTYFIAMVIIEKSAAKALVYAAIILAKTNVGQTYVMPIIPPKSGYSEEYANGRSLLFVFSPLIVVYATMIIAELKNALTTGFKSIPSYVPMTLLYVATALYSSSLSRFIPELSMLYSLRFLGYTVWCVSAMRLGNGDRGKTLITMVRLFAVTAIFELIICIGQLFTGGMLGLTIENAVSLDIAASDDFTFLIRPVGLHTNPNQLANTYMELLFIGILLFPSNRVSGLWKLIKLPLLAIVISSVTIIILSRCRSAYLALLLITPLLLFVSDIRSGLLHLYQAYQPIMKRWRFLISELGLLFGAIIFLRAFFSLNTFQEFGDYYLREKLSQEAQIMIQRFLPWGVGTGMFIPAAQELFGGTHNFFFPEAVHNGYLLILAENGPVALLFFGLSYILFFRWVLAELRTDTERAIGIAGLVGSGIMMIFQPFINILPYITVFSYLYAKSHQLYPQKHNP